MELRRFDDVDDFIAAAGPFLVAREAEHNLILGVTSSLRNTPDEYTGPPYLAAAIHTPPFSVVLSEIDDPAAIACLADDLVDRDLPGALGPVEHIRDFVDARMARGGPPAHLHLSERIFRLRTLAASNISGLLLAAAVFSQFFLLTLYMQQVLHYSALNTGVAYVALTLSIIGFSAVSQ